MLGLGGCVPGAGSVLRCGVGFRVVTFGDCGKGVCVLVSGSTTGVFGEV